MINKKLIIDLEEENTENKQNTDTLNNNDFQVNISLDNEKLDSEEDEKHKQIEVKKNNDFGISTNLSEENEKEDKSTLDIFSQITEKGISVDDNIDKQVYKKIISEHKKKGKFKYVVISFLTLLIFTIVGGGIYFTYDDKNKFLTDILTTKKNNSKLKKQNITHISTNESKNLPIIEKKYYKLKNQVVSYYKENLFKKVKDLKSKDKKNIMFKFAVLKYEFGKDYINFKQFIEEYNKILDKISNN